MLRVGHRFLKKLVHIKGSTETSEVMQLKVVKIQNYQNIIILPVFVFRAISEIKRVSLKSLTPFLFIRNEQFLEHNKYRNEVKVKNEKVHRQPRKIDNSIFIFLILHPISFKIL